MTDFHNHSVKVSAISLQGKYHRYQSLKLKRISPEFSPINGGWCDGLFSFLAFNNEHLINKSILQLICFVSHLTLLSPCHNNNAGVQHRRGVFAEVWFERRRQRPVQRPHRSGRGRQWEHHSGRLGQQQDTGQFKTPCLNIQE